MAQMQSHSIARKLAVLKRRFHLTKPKCLAAGLIVMVLVGGLVFALVYLRTPGFMIGQSDGKAAPSIEESKLKELATQADTNVEQATTSSQAQTSEAAPSVVVHIDGVVAKPGVYTIVQAKPRIRDVVDLAGGMTEEADSSTINLAAMVEDGSKIHIPKQGETPLVEGSTAVAEGDGSASMGVSSQNGSAQGLININTATEQELMSLPGVGKSTAQAIIEDRRTNGVFTTTEDLMRVSGIGSKKFAKLQGKIRV